jgi:hypothetical protein
MLVAISERGSLARLASLSELCILVRTYAFGWGRLDAPNGRNAFLSNGEVQGGRADILVVPEDKTVIVVAENTHSGSPDPDELTVAIAENEDSDSHPR